MVVEIPTSTENITEFPPISWDFGGFLPLFAAWGMVYLPRSGHITPNRFSDIVGALGIQGILVCPRSVLLAYSLVS